jgi:hypothetical protein
MAAVAAVRPTVVGAVVAAVTPPAVVMEDIAKTDHILASQKRRSIPGGAFLMISTSQHGDRSSFLRWPDHPIA